MQTRAHSGISNPSLRRLIPINASNKPSRRSLMISIRSRVSTSECIYLTFKPASNIYSLRASAIFLVRVVIKTLLPFFDCIFVS